MNIKEIAEELKAFSLFANLSSESLLTIVKKIKVQIIPQNTVFINQGDISNTVYFIVKGSVKIYTLTEDGEEVNISLGGSGTVVGEMALVDEVPRSANAQTLQDSEVFVLTGADFKGILNEYPDIAINLLKVFSQRLRESVSHIEEISLQTLTERTLKTLYILKNFFPNNEINLSQEELSSIIGATRARITEALNILKDQGKIFLSYRKIRVI